MPICSLCGGVEFTSHQVLWPELVSAWQLAAHEVAYVDDQQGCTCNACGASLRVVALGQALQDAWQTGLTVQEFVCQPAAAALQVLDLNGAAGLSEVLSSLPGYVRADYPAVDMHSLPYAAASFDIVMHSDTLEHVEWPLLALQECRRVLAPGGRLCFTVPIIVGRLTRSRLGLAKSHHGDPSTTGDDFLVRTEFGVDAWTILAQAGFPRTMINVVQYPAATALSAW